MYRECEKEKDCPHANEISPNQPAEITPLFNSISQKKQKVNANALRKLRESKKIPAKEIVSVVQILYPKYDKTLQSKCERGEEYGIDLKSDAMDTLIKKYAPEQLEAIRRKRSGGHRLTKKIACRLEDDEYEKLIRYTHEDGFNQMQSWLTWVVRQYLKKKAGKENNNGQL